MKINFFTKNELLGTGFILVIIIVFTLYNLNLSLRRARDSQRRADIGALVDSLDKFRSDFGFFPPSVDGKIAACKDQDFDNFTEILKDTKPEDAKNTIKNYFKPCQWGKDSISNIFSQDSVYMPLIPSDPKTGEGYSYLYMSDDNFVQLYAYLEGGGDEIGYQDGIVKRNLHCGNNICNFGKSYADIPLDKSIEEYENELRLNR